MRILLALGGNALLRRGETASAENQRRNVELAAAALAELAAEHELIVSHGYGLRVGHLLELALRNALPDRDVVSVLTQVVVAADDPAFHMANKATVPSPEPRAIAEVRSLRALVDAGSLVVCAGGIPVSMDDFGALAEVEAVVDTDLTAALLARRLDAEMLLMLTDVEAVHADWGGPRDHPLAHVTAHELRGLTFAPGAMGAKVDAACRFVDTSGSRAAIGAFGDASRLARGEAGTQVLAPVAESVRRWVPTSKPRAEPATLGLTVNVGSTVGGSVRPGRLVLGKATG